MVKFDLRNAVLEDYLAGTQYPPRLEVTAMQPLREALESSALPPETELLGFEYQDQLLVFPLATVVCYNVIQGQLNDQPWMMTFCNACNAGMVFDPTLNGETLRFHRRGSYNGMLLIWDDITNTYWNHITGEGLHGDKAGETLNRMMVTRQMKADEALARHPNALVLIKPPETEDEATFSTLMQKMQKKPARFADTAVDVLVYEDTRLPRYDLGLGIWDDDKSVFFPVTSIYAQDNIAVTSFQGRKVLIYQSPDAISPIAVYLDDVQSGYWQGDTLYLNNGGRIQDDQYTAPDGTTQLLERPMQLLMRWYGFALTFPGCEIGTQTA